MIFVMFLLVFCYGIWIINIVFLRLWVGLLFWLWLWFIFIIRCIFVIDLRIVRILEFYVWFKIKIENKKINCYVSYYIYV